MKLTQQALDLLEDRKQRTREFAALQPDHPFTAANEHMLEMSAQTSWNATGVLTMTGVLWWALNLTADLAPPHYIVFNATGGPSADIALFTSAVTGFFFVDPSTLDGELNFTMQAAAVGDGEVTLNLYDQNWSQVASFAGLAAGLSASYISGSGTFSYH